MECHECCQRNRYFPYDHKFLYSYEHARHGFQVCREEQHRTLYTIINPLHTKGVVFISCKNENVNKDACHAHYLQQNPIDPYI